MVVFYEFVSGFFSFKNGFSIVWYEISAMNKLNVNPNIATNSIGSVKLR